MAIPSLQMRAAIRAVQTSGNPHAGGTSLQVETSYDLTEGTTAGAADQIYIADRTVASGANDDIDLSPGPTNIFGGAQAMVKIVGILIINAPSTGAANTTNLTIGAGTAPFLGFLGGTTPTIGPIRPGGYVMLGCDAAAGLGTVTATSADILRIANSAGASATYQIGIVARSA